MSKTTKNTKTTTTNAVVPVTSSALEQVPEYLRSNTSRGMDAIESDDLILPRIGVAQGLSPQLDRGKPEYIPGLEIGEMFNTVTRERMGLGPQDFVVIRVEKPRWIEFIPREQGGGLKDANVPAGDPRTLPGPDGEPPVATRFDDFLVLLMPQRELIVLSCKGTSIFRTAKMLKTLMKMRQLKVPGVQLDSWAMRFTMKSVGAQNKKGKWNLLQVENAQTEDDSSIMDPRLGCVLTEEAYNFCASVYESVRDRDLSVSDREPGQDDEVAGPASPEM